MAEPGDAEDVQLSRREKLEVEHRKQPRAQILYEAIRVEGEHELARPPSALAWSALAAGLSMGFSLVARGLARAALPDAPWAKLVVDLGYPIGFLIVIVARQQLFTENTLTPVIPLLQNKDRRTLLRLARLWAIVLAANLAGTLAFAFVLHSFGIFPAEVKHAFAGLGQEALAGGFASHFIRAIFAGWLIALMMWMLAGSSSRAFLVVTITYLVGLAGFSHVIAGAGEAFYAVLDGHASAVDFVVDFLLPVGLGNILGGTALVSALSRAQIVADAKATP
jgi:formate/nitrite transporter FocA (FNT family)